MRLRTGTTILVIFVAGALVAGAVPLLTADLASADGNDHLCDFLTGGGWILPPAGGSNGVKANFAIAGGCKKKGPDAPFWGHLNYLDHGTTIKPDSAPTPFHVHWTSIEAYVFIDQGPNKRGQPTGTREVCGTATTNDLLAHPVVHFRVRVHDDGEPGTSDTFWMHLSDHPPIPHSHEVFYDTGNNFLGGGGPGGGNIQLHKPNPSTNEDLGFNSCPYP
jgi:hypothetical protein